MFGLLALMGAALISVGAGMYSLPAGLITAGAWCVLVAFAAERAQQQRAPVAQPERERIP